MKLDLTVSIVLYNDSVEKLRAAMRSVLRSTLQLKLYLVDNSPTDRLRQECSLARCEYIFSDRNLGFGKGHNVAMRRSVNESSYHLVLNPDVYFGSGVLETIFAYMQAHPDIGQVMPKVLYPDGRLQHLCKLLPSPADLLCRRFFPWFPGARKRNRMHELLDTGYNQVMNLPFLSGCFMFLRNSAVADVGFFDPRIFMYMEDADLTRRLHQRFRTVYYPEVCIYHHFGKGSYKSFRLLLYAMHGSMMYFNKWGWITDLERNRMNQSVRKQYIRDHEMS